MNTLEILKRNLYPRANQNVRRKEFPYFDTISIASGTMEYFFFTTALSDQFSRNKKFPIQGSEIFFLNAISLYIEKNVVTTALIDDMNELLQQSFLEISVDNRVVCKLPGLDFISYLYGDTLTATGSTIAPLFHSQKRKLPLPIILNSSSAFQFKFVMPTSAATAFNGVDMRLSFHGIQLDKLSPFYWDNLKRNRLQEVPVTYYNTFVIPNANEQTFELFADGSINQKLFSQNFPLSDIQTFSCQDIEVFVNQPDTPIEPITIYNSRIQNLLKIQIDDVKYYEANLQDMLSVFAGFGTTLTTTPDTAVVNILNVRQSKTLRIPIEFPSNSKVRVSLTQPSSSLGITGEITIALRGVETRRVA